MTHELPNFTPNCVLEVLENTTAPAAYWLLHLMDCPNEMVYLECGELIYVKDLVKQDSICYLEATAVNVLFWGGPPNQLAWYRGTLQNLIADRILDYYTKNSLEALVEKLCLHVH